MRALWLALVLMGCGQTGTGVLIDLEGALQLDGIDVEAHFDNRTATHSVATSSLPTSFLAILPDEDTTVKFAVTARLGSAIVASATTESIAVTAHHIADATVSFGGVDLGGPSGDGPSNGNILLVHGGSPPQGAAFTGIWGISTSDLYVTAMAFNGVNLYRSSNHAAGFTTSSVGINTPDLFGVSGAGSTVLLVGDRGMLLRGQGTSFTAEFTPAGMTPLRAVWCASATEAYVVGDGHAILHSVTGGWVQQSTVGSQALLGVWGSDLAHVWAVGEAGTILFGNGAGTWIAQASGTTATLRSIHGAGGAIYAVGDGGTILRSIGDGTWTPEASATTSNLYGVFARATDVTAVGEAWSVVRSTGGPFGPMTTSLPVVDAVTDRLRAAFRDASALYVVGSGQVVLRVP